MNRLTIFGLLFITSYLLIVNIRKALRAWTYSRRARQWGCQRAPPRPGKYPGSIDHISRLLKADKVGLVPDEYIKIWSEQPKGDTYEQHILGSIQFNTTNPRNIQAMLATQFEDFGVGPIRREAFGPMLGLGIFTADGEAWKHSRALLRPQFTRDQVSQFTLEETHVKNLMEKLNPNSAGWISQVDLGPLFFSFTIDSATEFLFGQSINSQTQRFSDPRENQGFDWGSLAGAFDRGTAALGVRARLSELYWLHNPKQFQKDCEEVHRFADYFVKRALDKQASKEKEIEAERYVFLDELAKDNKDPLRLRSELLNILLAGRDTTAGLLGWACWNLARNPRIFTKLRNEIIDAFGQYGSTREITFSGLKSCTYLQHTINETLRLFPPVPLNSRISTCDTTLPNGGGPDGKSPVYVPKGAEVGFPVYVMHRRKDLWGEDAAEFRPERWVGRKPGWEFMPFNGGPRICLGQQLALTQAGYVLTKLLQRFDKMEASFPTEELRHQYSLTSAPKQVIVNLHSGEKQN